MSGYRKHFQKGGKNMSFSIDDDRVLVKYLEQSQKHARYKNS